MPIDLVIHTPGGLVLAAMQIARTVEAHKAKVTVYVPVYAMICDRRHIVSEATREKTRSIAVESAFL